VALLILIGVLFLYGILAHNPLTSWVFWVGLIAGVATILGLVAFGGGRSGGGSSGRRRRARRIDESGEATGEL
jgi:hypothetical protein